MEETMIDRRGFLVLSAVGAAAGVLGGCSTRSQQSGAAKTVDHPLEAVETDVDLGGVTVRTWAYGGQVPGREIRIRKGETLRAQVTNKLPQDTTVHWHGLAIPNNMDGVPVLTQHPIAAGVISNTNTSSSCPRRARISSIPTSAPSWTAACTHR